MYASPDDYTCVFFRICAPNIMVEFDLEPESLYLAMGTVDRGPGRPPGCHIFVGSKAPWYEFADLSVRFDTRSGDE